MRESYLVGWDFQLPTWECPSKRAQNVPKSIIWGKLFGGSVLLTTDSSVPQKGKLNVAKSIILEKLVFGVSHERGSQNL